jgi:predicted Zn-ribbon and HTH transcriptional regulator
VPSCDINVLLIGIRIASYGHDMNIASRCPKCSHDHEFVLDLRKLLESLGRPDYDKKLQIGDLTFGFRPLTYRQINDNNILQYEDQKLMRIMNQTDLTDQKKMELIGDSFRKITQLTMIAVSQCIAAIATDSSIVTDQNHIAEYLANCEKDIFNQIRDHIGELKTVSDFRPLDLTCENCGHQYQQEFSLDISNFFETNS